MTTLPAKYVSSRAISHTLCLLRRPSFRHGRPCPTRNTVSLTIFLCPFAASSILLFLFPAKQLSGFIEPAFTVVRVLQLNGRLAANEAAEVLVAEIRDMVSDPFAALRPLKSLRPRRESRPRSRENKCYLSTKENKE